MLAGGTASTITIWPICALAFTCKGAAQQTLQVECAVYQIQAAVAYPGALEDWNLSQSLAIAWSTCCSYCSWLLE